MQVRVSNAYPVYGLDRYIRYQNGWNVHTRGVLYGSSEYLRQNEDVVSQALARSKDLLRRVNDQSRTASEENLVAVLCLVPDTIGTIPLAEILPGVITCLNVDYYIEPPLNHENYFDSYEKLQAIRRVLDHVSVLSVYRALQSTKRKSDIWDSVGKFMKNSGIVETTVSKLFQYGVDCLLNRLNNKP